jgi:hypothetical protein
VSDAVSAKIADSVGGGPGTTSVRADAGGDAEGDNRDVDAGAGRDADKETEEVTGKVTEKATGKPRDVASDTGARKHTAPREQHLENRVVELEEGLRTESNLANISV